MKKGLELSKEALEVVEEKFDLDDTTLEIKKVLEFISDNGLSDKIKMPKSKPEEAEKQDIDL